ncbi:unnamed protein product [Periconia digitata]|uniref:Uncharacterized protein n=1 Tax=Periconia digitata TaxID=1303443 RepID=A0A9W4UHF6_9PLEO|nr:unnamed protein product [Periconia digitata]
MTAFYIAHERLLLADSLRIYSIDKMRYRLLAFIIASGSVVLAKANAGPSQIAYGNPTSTISKTIYNTENTVHRRDLHDVSEQAREQGYWELMVVINGYDAKIPVFESDAKNFCDQIKTGTPVPAPKNETPSATFSRVSTPIAAETPAPTSDKKGDGGIDPTSAELPNSTASENSSEPAEKSSSKVDSDAPTGTSSGGKSAPTSTVTRSKSSSTIDSEMPTKSTSIDPSTPMSTTATTTASDQKESSAENSETPSKSTPKDPTASAPPSASASPTVGDQSSKQEKSSAEVTQETATTQEVSSTEPSSTSKSAGNTTEEAIAVPTTSGGKDKLENMDTVSFTFPSPTKEAKESQQPSPESTTSAENNDGEKEQSEEAEDDEAGIAWIQRRSTFETTKTKLSRAHLSLPKRHNGEEEEHEESSTQEPKPTTNSDLSKTIDDPHTARETTVFGIAPEPTLQETIVETSQSSLSTSSTPSPSSRSSSSSPPFPSTFPSSQPDPTFKITKANKPTTTTTEMPSSSRPTQPPTITSPPWENEAHRDKVKARKWVHILIGMLFMIPALWGFCEGAFGWEFKVLSGWLREKGEERVAQSSK